MKLVISYFSLILTSDSQGRVVRAQYFPNVDRENLAGISEPQFTHLFK